MEVLNIFVYQFLQMVTLYRQDNKIASIFRLAQFRKVKIHMLSFFLRPRLGTSDSLEINCLQEIYHSGFTFLMLVVWAILGKNVISIPAHTQENKISHIFDLFVKTAFFQYCQILLKIMNKPKDINNEKVATVYRQQVFLAKYSEMYPCLKPFSFRNSFGKMEF